MSCSILPTYSTHTSTYCPNTNTICIPPKPQVPCLASQEPPIQSNPIHSSPRDAKKDVLIPKIERCRKECQRQDMHAHAHAPCPAATNPCSKRASLSQCVSTRLGNNTTFSLVAPSAVIDTSRNCRLVGRRVEGRVMANEEVRFGWLQGLLHVSLQW
jgi:hypothetical protein